MNCLFWFATPKKEGFLLEISLSASEKFFPIDLMTTELRTINNAGVITVSPKTIKQDEIQIKVSKNTPTGQSEILGPGDIGTSGVEGETIKIITNKIQVLL